MKYENRASVDIKRNPQATIPRNSIIQVGELALQSLNFCQSLLQIPHIVSLDRQKLRAQAQETIKSATWQKRNHALKLEPARVEEFVTQRLTRQFFITERFTSFAAAQLPYLQESTTPLEDRICMLSPSQLALVERVARYCPLSAGITAAFLAEDFSPKDKNNRLDQVAVKTALVHKETLAVAFEAILAVESFIVELCSRAKQPLSKNLTQLMDAWRQDLTLPIIEATIYTVAVGISALEKGFDAGASWYLSHVSLSEDNDEARIFYNNWRDVSRGVNIVGRLVLYDGIDFESRAEKHRVIKNRKIPIPLLIGAHDPTKFLCWYREVFNTLQDSITASTNLNTHRFEQGSLARIPNGAQILLRRQAEFQGQARIGITTPQALGQISIRLDLEDRHLTLDFGALTPADLFERQKDLLRLNKKNIEQYRELRALQTDRTSSNRKMIDKDLNKHERLNRLSKKISHFSNDSSEAMKQMPTFVAALSGVGRSLAIRHNDQIGHHSLEALYRLSLDEASITQNFAMCVTELEQALKNSK